MGLCPVGAVHYGHRDKGAVARHGDAFRRLADSDSVHDARRLGFQVDDSDGVGIALPATLIADNRNIAFCANFDAVGPIAAYHELFGVLDFAAIYRQDRDLVITVTRDERGLAVGSEGSMARSRLGVAELDLA